MSGFALSIDSYRNSDVNYLTSPENVKLRRDLMRGLDRARARTNSARLPIDAVTMQLMDDTGFGGFALAFRRRDLRRQDTLVGDGLIGRGRLRRRVNWRRLDDISTLRQRLV